MRLIYAIDEICIYPVNQAFVSYLRLTWKKTTQYKCFMRRVQIQFDVPNMMISHRPQLNDIVVVFNDAEGFVLI